MRWAALIWLALTMHAMAQTTPAQQTNPVVAHYHEYRAAIERNDLAAAETAAEAALAASEARDGDGGRTGVLALNLAQVRLDRSRANEALAPARRAHDLATRRGASAVDLLAARLAPNWPPTHTHAKRVFWLRWKKPGTDRTCILKRSRRRSHSSHGP